jgi:hypothetical protein
MVAEIARRFSPSRTGCGDDGQGWGGLFCHAIRFRFYSKSISRESSAQYSKACRAAPLRAHRRTPFFESRPPSKSRETR